MYKVGVFLVLSLFCVAHAADQQAALKHLMKEHKGKTAVRPSFSASGIERARKNVNSINNALASIRNNRAVAGGNVKKIESDLAKYSQLENQQMALLENINAYITKAESQLKAAEQETQQKQQQGRQISSLRGFNKWKEESLGKINRAKVIRKKGKENILHLKKQKAGLEYKKTIWAKRKKGSGRDISNLKTKQSAYQWALGQR